jgi:hypothetical protein
VCGDGCWMAHLRCSDFAHNSTCGKQVRLAGGWSNFM